MSAFTYPGVYIEELSSGVHTITGVATSIAAFVGWAPQGPVDQATLVECWSEYEAQFGGFDSRSYLGYAVNQFFINGGQQAYIVRLAWDGSVPAAPGTNPAECATAVAAGLGYPTTQITASVGSIISPPVTLSVGTPALQSIAITPSNLPPIPSNAPPIQFTATGTNSDGSTTSTLTVNWASNNSGVVIVSASGLVTIVGPGTAIISATDSSGFISGSIALTVVVAKLLSILITPASPTLAAGQTQQLVATGNYSDGTTQDLTATCVWTSASSAEATVSSSGLAAAANGLTAAGSSAIKALWAGVTGNATVNVNVPTVVSIVISPLGPTILQAGPAPTFTANGIVSYNPPLPPAVPSPPAPAPVTSPAWTSSNPAVATINATSGAVAIVGAGSTTITVTAGSVSASTTLTIKATGVTLASISVTPAVASIANGLFQQLKATATFSDGTSADLTGNATWATSDTTDTEVTAGLVTGIAPTATTLPVTATITASDPQLGAVTGTAAITITAAVPVSIAVSPTSATIASGATKQFTAQATYSDRSTPDVTKTANWSSSTTSIATIVPTGSLGGLATAVATGGSLTLFANNPGAWGNNLRVTIAVQPPPNSNRFNILVQEFDPTTGKTSTLESFANLSVSQTDPQYVVTLIDNDSNYVSFIPPGFPPPLPVLPSGSPSPTAGAVALSGGADGDVLVPATDQNFELQMTTNRLAGVYLLNRVDIFNILCVPGETDMPTIQTLQGYCYLKRAFYIVDPPQTVTHASLQASGPVGTPLGSSASITGTGSQNSAYYFPWVSAPDPLFGNRPTLFPPCGFVAGTYASTDAGPGVWKAPAGINTALIQISGLQYNLTDIENGDLNPQAINCLRDFKAYGSVVWGARTLQGNDQVGSQWKYVSIRRLALFIESSLYDGTQWVVFEPNDEKLWGQIRLNVGTFMQGLFLKGAFQGTTPQQAYFVKCDSENNPESSIQMGIVNIMVGFAPLYPAEFVVIQIVQIAGQTS